jgi:succinate dehydrogenase flavin-adding protein (antitoxin of CptAB toxin-antitoxin module)
MKGSFKVEYLETSIMLADGLTKALTQQQHEKFVQLLNMQDSRLLIMDLEEKAPQKPVRHQEDGLSVSEQARQSP